MNREKAWEVLNEYTLNPALIRHGLCVEAVMRHADAGYEDAKACAREHGLNLGAIEL